MGRVTICCKLCGNTVKLNLDEFGPSILIGDMLCPCDSVEKVILRVELRTRYLLHVATLLADQPAVSPPKVHNCIPSPGQNRSAQKTTELPLTTRGPGWWPWISSRLRFLESSMGRQKRAGFASNECSPTSLIPLVLLPYFASTNWKEGVRVQIS